MARILSGGDDGHAIAQVPSLNGGGCRGQSPLMKEEGVMQVRVLALMGDEKLAGFPGEPVRQALLGRKFSGHVPFFSPPAGMPKLR